MKKVSLFIIMLLGANVVQASEMPSLIQAIRRENLDEVKEEIIKAKAAETLDQVFHHKTALHFAVRNFHPAIWPLISAGADVNKKDDDNGRTPLFDVVEEPSLIEMLTKAGALPNSRDGIGLTALHHAVDRELKINPRVVTALLKAGALTNIKSYVRCETPLIYMIGVGKTIRRHKTGVVKLLLEANPKLINEVDVHSRSPLHYAKIKAIAQFFIDAGANPNAIDSNENTPLHCATTKDTIKVLINAGANPKAINSEGQTPLHIIAHHGSTSAIKMLAPVSSLESYDHYGHTPLHNAVTEVSSKKKWAHVLALIKAGANAQAPVKKEKWTNENEIGDTPLHTAARRGRGYVVSLLLKGKCPPTKPCVPTRTFEAKESWV